jgi:hypothetical protein
MNTALFTIPQVTPSKRYAVMRDGVQIGTVLANNYSHANTKALQLFKRHVYVQPLT